MQRRVAITGIGAVTPVGNDAETTWRALLEGRSGVGRITTFPPESFVVQIAGLVKDFDLSRVLPDRRMRRYLSRAAGYGIAATLEALASAGVSPETYEPEERGIAMGGSVGRPELSELTEILHAYSSSEGKRLSRQQPSTVMVRDQNFVLGVMGLIGNCQGPAISVSTACTASAHALGEAFRSVQEGDAKLMIAGGYDALTSYLDVLGFSLLGALNTECNDTPQKASRPFDRERAGFVLGEGAVTVIMEEWESARERGAPILAEVAGYGSSMNAYRITDAPPDGGGTILAVSNAIKDSGLRPDQIDYVVAHGTSTPGNDLCETNALKAVFGDHAYKLAISSPKSMTGHLTAAAGGLNLLAAVLGMRDSVVAPTVNYEHPDPKLDLDYVPNTARKMQVRAALVDAFAFGGTNASMVVRHPEFAGG
jgi:3-oxoacyl-[acyl-carrier-protein] synthase II